MKQDIKFEKIDKDKHVLVGYLQGDKIDNSKHLTLDMFDSICKIKTTENPINKKPFIQAVGHFNGFPYVLVIKSK
jgi:hypothetical protein